jgi:DNA (cytosine-5)-methyltransferase 1
MGWEAAFFSEIEKFPCAVLEHRYPNVPLHGDFTTIKENEYGKIDLLVGGTPCQSFSVAGLRGGLDDDRGNLALEFCRLAQREQPRWIVWENVPGVLSSSGGRDFGSILGALEDIGYGLAYRVLDAQYFGVAQRRRRVFVVGYLGDWRPAAAVLFERHSMSGHPAPSREKRQEATDTAATGTGGSGSIGRARPDLDTFECGGIGSYSASDNSSPLLRTGADLGPGCEALIASTFSEDGTARTLTARYDSSPCVDRGPDVVGTLRAHHPGTAGVQGDTDHIVAFTARDYGADATEDLAPTMRSLAQGADGHQSGSHGLAVAYPINTQLGLRGPDVSNTSRDGFGVGDETDPAYTLQANHAHAVAFDTVRDVSPTITSNYGKQLDSSDTALGPNVVLHTATHEVAGTLMSHAKSGGWSNSIDHAVAGYMALMSAEAFQSSQSGVRVGETHATLDANNGPRRHNGALIGSTVRRLTPVECERLQGFPDNFTAIPWRKKGAEDCPDGPRYKALGNSMAVPVMRWIGERINLIDDYLSII